MMARMKSISIALACAGLLMSATVLAQIRLWYGFTVAASLIRI
jgi:hypothetical protein